MGKEPFIYAGDLSSEELLTWLNNQAVALLNLHQLEKEKAALEGRLVTTSKAIDEISIQFQSGIFRTN